jgi:DNA-binding transcriptional MerR regulator
MYNIGEFSRITGLTVKTLRFYHEEDLLEPASVDAHTGYRHYAASQIEAARAISYLRELEFPVAEIRKLLRSDDAGVLEAMEQQRAVLEERIKRCRTASRSLERFIREEREARAMANQSEFHVEEKVLSPMLVAGVRMRGHYGDSAKGFAKVARSFGRDICGKAMMLHYDTEYKEDDADFEACMPVRRRKDVADVSVRELPGGRCVALVHKGPYDQLFRSYARILDYVRAKGYRAVSPSREVYIKGPGMIFSGNPKNYVTEIQMLVE